MFGSNLENTDFSKINFKYLAGHPEKNKAGSTFSTCKDKLQKGGNLHVKNKIATSTLGKMEQICSSIPPAWESLKPKAQTPSLAPNRGWEGGWRRRGGQPGALGPVRGNGQAAWVPFPRVLPTWSHGGWRPRTPGARTRKARQTPAHCGKGTGKGQPWDGKLSGKAQLHRKSCGPASAGTREGGTRKPDVHRATLPSGVPDGLTVGRPQPTVSVEPPWGQGRGPPPEVTRPLLSCTRGGVRGTWRRRGACSALPGVCVGPCGSRNEAVGHRRGLPGPGDPPAASGREDSDPSCASDEAGPPVPSPPDTVSEKASWNRRFRKLSNPVIHTQNVQIPMETPPACYTEKTRIPSLNLKSQQPAPPDEETGMGRDAFSTNEGSQAGTRRLART